jgi:hypothetical protein
MNRTVTSPNSSGEVFRIRTSLLKKVFPKPGT